MSVPQDSCVQPARGPILAPAGLSSGELEPEKEIGMQVARVGKKAPDFEAGAYVDGGFKNITLSEYFGKWIVLCFYPGDFTFV